MAISSSFTHQIFPSAIVLKSHSSVTSKLHRFSHVSWLSWQISIKCKLNEIWELRQNRKLKLHAKLSYGIRGHVDFFYDTFSMVLLFISNQWLSKEQLNICDKTFFPLKNESHTSLQRHEGGQKNYSILAYVYTTTMYLSFSFEILPYRRHHCQMITRIHESN